MYRLCAILLLTFGCECIPPEGSRPAERFRDRWDAVVETYREHGHEYRGAPLECLRVTVRPESRFMCGGVRTDGCYHPHTWPVCPAIETAAGAVGIETVEHELLHYLLDLHGVDSHDHAADFPDFFRVVYRSYEKTNPR